MARERRGEERRGGRRRCGRRGGGGPGPQETARRVPAALRGETGSPPVCLVQFGPLHVAWFGPWSVPAYARSLGRQAGTMVEIEWAWRPGARASNPLCRCSPSSEHVRQPPAPRRLRPLLSRFSSLLLQNIYNRNVCQNPKKKKRT